MSLKLGTENEAEPILDEYCRSRRIPANKEQEEQKLAYYRIAWGSSVEPDAEFSFRKAITVFKTDRLWPAYMAIGMGIGVPLYSVANWLPQVVERFGFPTVKTNLYTVAPNVVGSTFLVCVAFSSDYFQDRCLHLAGCLSITCIGELSNRHLWHRYHGG